MKKQNPYGVGYRKPRFIFEGDPRAKKAGEFSSKVGANVIIVPNTSRSTVYSSSSQPVIVSGEMSGIYFIETIGTQAVQESSSIYFSDTVLPSVSSVPGASYYEINVGSTITRNSDAIYFSGNRV